MAKPLKWLSKSTQGLLCEDLLSLSKMKSCCAVFPRGFSCGRVSKKQSHSLLLPTGSLISLFIKQYSQCKLTQPLSTWPAHVNSMGETAGIKDWVMDDVSKCFVGHKWTHSHTCMSIMMTDKHWCMSDYRDLLPSAFIKTR